MQNFRALGASPPDPHWPPAAGGSAPRPPKQPPPIANFWLRACVFLGHLSSLWSIWLIFYELVGVATWHSCEIKFLIEESSCSDTLPR